MNKVLLSGNISTEPEIKIYHQLSEGKDVEKKVASFNLAIDILEGRRQEEASFFRCAGFGKRADIIEAHCKKGNKIIVEGFLKPNNYEKDGVKVYSNNVVVRNIEFCSAKQNKEEKKENDEDEFMDIPEGEDLGFPSPF